MSPLKYFVVVAVLTLVAVLFVPREIRPIELTEPLKFVRRVEASDVYRIPTVPMGMPTFYAAHTAAMGIVATFRHLRPQPGRPKVAVEMSGHMRTFRKCHASLVANVLKPNGAVLFMATYPDLGDKRFGVRVQEHDSEAPLQEIAEIYQPHLAMVYWCDAPTVEKGLRNRFPRLFNLTQWSWMIYQLYQMETAHEMARRYAESGFFSDVEVSDGTFRPMRYPQHWTSFDVVVRVRPDLYILSRLELRWVDTTHETCEATFSCGKTVVRHTFGRRQILRAPHHPRYEWYIDPLSDHTVVGFMGALDGFLTLFSDARNKSSEDQQRIIFKHGTTAEKIWWQYSERLGLETIRIEGWHVMLRNEKKIFNTTTLIATSRIKRIFTEKIFGETDASKVQCARPGEKNMIRMPPKPPKPHRAVRG